MMLNSHSKFRPSIRNVSVLSRTENNNDLSSTLETIYDRSFGHISRKSRSRKVRYNKLLLMIKAYDTKFQNFSEVEFDEKIKKIQVQLRRYGFADYVLAETFALVREACGRSLCMRHFDSQILGALSIFHGCIAEMPTGEGKTLTAVLAAASSALAGIPTHIITVNDYLAERDADEMKIAFERMGLTVGNVIQGKSFADRQIAYACDITYCTNNELVFDYLKDSIELKRFDTDLSRYSHILSGNKELTNKLMLRGLHFAVVDEADSVLLDEAVTPLVISGEVPAIVQEKKMYEDAMYIANELNESLDYIIHKASSTVEILPQGKCSIDEKCSLLGEYWQGRIRRIELVKKALIAIHLFSPDHQYLVQDGKIVIIDQNTGRLMPDRSWEQGLHQLIEIKEGCELSNPRKTLAKISYQHFFSLYHHLSGMSGTAKEVSNELWNIYHLPVVKIPTNKPCLREYKGYRLYFDKVQHCQAIALRVKTLIDKKRAILVGTVSVFQSEMISKALDQLGLKHKMLSAKHNEHEAQVVADAGHSSSITVATGMAGRGTDIKISMDVFQNKGLHVIVANLNKVRRIDRQLYGRCARQGDPGSYEFMISLDDFESNTTLDRVSNFIISKSFKIDFLRQFSDYIAFTFLRYKQHKYERNNAHIRMQLLRTDQKKEKSLSFVSNRI